MTPQKTLNTHACLALLICIGAVSNGFAAEMKVSGFASLIFGQTIKDADLKSAGTANGQVSRYLTDPSNVGNTSSYYDQDLSFNPDSNFGLQLDTKLNEHVSFTVQATSKGTEDFEPGIEWLYATIKLNTQFKLKIGRQRAPRYFYSDFQEVGYVYHWIRPPMEVYGEGTFTYTGLSLTHSAYVYDWDIETMFFMGDKKNENAGAVIGHIHLTKDIGVALTLNREALTIRAAYESFGAWVEETSSPPPGFGNFLGEENEKNGSYSASSSNYDTGTWFLGAEVTRLELNPFLQSGLNFIGLADRISWLITGGIRIGEFTPHLTLSSRTSELVGDTAPPPLAPSLEGLEVVANVINLGLRWDFRKSTALKIDYTSSTDDSDDFFQTLNGKPNEVDVFAVGIDLMF